MKPTLVIMAAGMGSRYGGLKQIDPVGPSGEIVLDYSIYDAIQAGFGEVVFIIRSDIEEAFKKAVGAKFEDQIDVKYVFQTLDKVPDGFSIPEGRIKPWGTGQAVLMAAEVVRKPFAVLNADDFYGRQSFNALAQELGSSAVDSSASCMVGFYIKNTISPNGAVTRGQCVVENGVLKTVVERLKIERQEDEVIRYEEAGKWYDMGEEEVTSMNMWGFTPQLFEPLRADFKRFLEREGKELKSEHLLPMVIDDLIRKKQTCVKVLPTDEKWMGVTYPEDKPLVVAGIREWVDAGLYPENLWG